MFEAISLVIFAGVIYFCLVVAPSVMEFFNCEKCSKVCLKHAESEQ